MEAMDIQAVESKLSDVTVTAIPMASKSAHKDLGQAGANHTTISSVPLASPSLGKDKDGVSKYAQLLAVIEEMGKEVRPSYSGSRSSAERLKRGIVHARILVRECLIETERSARQYGNMAWSTRWRWETGLNADSVEWCPVAPYQHALVCGTYQLDKEAVGNPSTQKRLGRIYLFTITEDTTDLKPIQTIETAGILDQKWCYHAIQNHPVLAIVTSEGGIQLYRLIDEDGTLSLKFWTSDMIGQGILALSLDWSTSKTFNEEAQLVVSDSSGNITVFRVVGDGLQKIGVWNGHGFEAWIAAFNYWNENIFYSGGDDCAFKSYDTRVPDVAVATTRRHEAGVTAIRCHESEEHQLLTGSYDENLRLWDPRQLKDCITEVDVNCGVWRVRWHPRKHDHILAACMYGGFRILKLEDSTLSVVSEYLEHESIAYGADWRFDKDMVATCSFYDCRMHISDICIV